MSIPALSYLENRLVQMARLVSYLQENYRFFMEDREVYLACSLKDPIVTVVACNFLDINRYLMFDHKALAKEPARLFLHEFRNCGAGCRLDGKFFCYCRGKCFGEKKCGWLRHEKGIPYCYLAHPWVPPFPTVKKDKAFYKRKVLSLCTTDEEREWVERNF